MKFQWSIVNSQLVLTEAGHVVEIDIAAIFASYFENKPIMIEGSQVAPVQHYFPDLLFSKYPAYPCFLVESTSEEQIIVSICVEIGDHYVRILNGSDHVIADNTVFAVSSAMIHELTDILHEKSITPGVPITIDQLIALRMIEDVRLFEDAKIKLNSLHEKGIEGCDLIPGLQAQLYPFQKDGVGFLHAVANQNIGCILGDEMGLGKTLQVIALLQLEKNAGKGSSLVIVPATVIQNWGREFAHFAPDLSVLVHEGPHRTGIPSGLLGFDVVIVSYDTARLDEAVFAAFKWNILALDEAQDIKNPDTKRTQFVKSLERRVSIAVSGTPVENRLEDLWSISDFVLPELLGPLSRFKSTYLNAEDDARELSKKVAPILLRRKLIDVMDDLPSKIEIPQPIEMTDYLANLYEDVRIATLEQYEGRMATLTTIGKLRQFCAHPKLLDDIWTEALDYEMSKYERTLQLFEEFFASNEKVLLFTYWTKMSELLFYDLRARWPEAYFNIINGSVQEAKKRQPIIDEFTNTSKYGALFLNPLAGGRGLNITAANHVIHYNPEWNPAWTDQATGRVYRIKQDKPVTVHHLYFLDTVEEFVYEKVRFKRMLAKAAVTGHDGTQQEKNLFDLALSLSPVKGRMS